MKLSDRQIYLLKALDSLGPDEGMYFMSHDRRVAGPLRTAGMVESYWSKDNQKLYRITSDGKTLLRETA